jgi:OmpA-OmpF porin, OOP family
METQHNTAHNHKLLRAMLAAVFAMGLVVLAGPVAAEGWYAGASYGNTEDRNWCDSSLGACDDTDNGWKVFAGNQFNRFVGVEFGYNDLGELTDTGITAEASGFVASLVGMIPIGNAVSFTGRVGSFLWKSDVNTSIPGISGSERSASLTVGIGANVALGKRVTVRAEWERFDVDDDDYSFISVGLAFNFGN